MKKRVWAIMVMALLLTGCAAREELAGASGAPDNAEAQTSGGNRTVMAAREMTEEEVLSVYDRAVKAYRWFDRETLPGRGPVLLVDGYTYQQVDYPGLETVEDLEIYLRSLFAAPIIDRLLDQEADKPLYCNIDGALFVHPYSRRADPGKGDPTTAVERREDGSFVVNVTVDLLDGDGRTVTGVRCSAFPYELVEGRWVFTEFGLVD